MDKIDLKDRKILYQLDLNCRQSNTQIGKKVGLRKDVVAYRIKRMEEEGIIKNYYTAINTYKLGYYVYRIYITFQDVNIDIKNEIIDYFKNHKNLWALLSAKGPVDLDAVIWVNDVYKFNQFWYDTLDKYGNYFSKYTVSILTQVIACKKSYLLLDEFDKSNREVYTINCSGNPVKIDKLDYQLLDEIVLNARIPLIELAEKLSCSSQTVNYKIKNLMKKGIILAFRIEIDKSKLGLQSCAIDIYLKDHSQRKQILNYIKNIPYVYDIMEMNIGWCDISFQIQVEHIDILNQIMEDLDNKFPNSIRKQNFWMSLFYHKERSLPELY